jgi:hypothetical protein
MKTIAGSILILAAAIILTPGLQEGSLHNAAIFAFPIGIAGTVILLWGLIGERAKKED